MLTTRSVIQTKSCSESVSIIGSIAVFPRPSKPFTLLTPCPIIRPQVTSAMISVVRRITVIRCPTRTTASIVVCSFDTQTSPKLRTQGPRASI